MIPGLIRKLIRYGMRQPGAAFIKALTSRASVKGA
jgi:hypothetical protein